jgi:hypothetical protein
LVALAGKNIGGRKNRESEDKGRGGASEHLGINVEREKVS